MDRGGPTLVASPWVAHLGLTVLFLCGLAAVIVLGRPPLPTQATMAVLALQAVLALALAAGSTRLPARPFEAMRVVILALIAAAAAVPGWFFGINSAFAAVVAVSLVFAGLLADRARGWSTTLAGWATYAAAAGGQAVVFALVITDVLPDVAVTPVRVRVHEDWEHALGHLAVQILYLGAFFSGRVLQRRYRRLVDEYDEVVRGTAVREALIAEAREDYRRAVAAGGRGVFSGQRVGSFRLGRVLKRRGIDEVYEAVAGEGEPLATVTLRGGPGLDESSIAERIVRTPEEDVLLEPVAEPTPPSDALEVAIGSGMASSASRALRDAYRYKTRRTYAWVVGLCLGGAVFLGVIADDRRGLLLAWACMAGILAITTLHWYLNRERRDDLVYWPWALIGALTVGPALSFGLHSGFAAVITTALLAGAAFRAMQRVSWLGSLALVLFGIMGAHGLAFALIAAHVVPDVGNVPVLRPSGLWWEPVVHHLLVQASYVIAFAAGSFIDDRYASLLVRMATAAREAARTESLLSAARAEVDRALAGEHEGIFSGQLLGRYQVGRLLGRGGMGEVYEATDPAGERLALKLIRREWMGDPRSLQLFFGEAATIERIRSPFVARILETGSPPGGVPYIAMEYIDGESLAKVLRAHPRLSIEETRALVHDVLMGLADVHQAGVLHRDVKPHNVMRTVVDGAPRWKLIDFGVSQLLASTMTDHLIAGTPSYMAPEQVQGARLDVRADFYSVCLIAYRALTGRPAYADQDLRHDLVALHRRGPVDPNAFVTLPRDLELVLRIGLAYDPGDRFATGLELRDSFAAACDGALPAAVRERGLRLLKREPWASPGS